MILVGSTGASSRTSGSAHRSPVNLIGPNGWSAMAATVSAAYPALDSPSTTPNDTPPDGLAKRAIRTAVQATLRAGTRSARLGSRLSRTPRPAGDPLRPGHPRPEYWEGDLAPRIAPRCAAPRRAGGASGTRRGPALDHLGPTGHPTGRAPTAARRRADGGHVRPAAHHPDHPRTAGRRAPGLRDVRVRHPRCLPGRARRDRAPLDSMDR